MVVPEFLDDVGEPEPGVVGGAGRHDGQGQRQPRAQIGDRGDGLRFGVDAGAAQPPGQQSVRFPGAQQIQRERVRPVPRDQAAEPAAAGDDDEAAGCAGQ